MASPRPLKGFSARLLKAAGSVRKTSNTIKRETAIEMLTQLVGATPVDTGRTRDAWNVSINAPNFTMPSGPYGGSRHRGQAITPAARGGTGAITKGRNFIRSAQVKYGVPVYIANGAPWLPRLNNGYSSQAPAQFIQIATARAEAIIKTQVARYARIFE